VQFDRLIDPGYWFEGASAGPATPITYALIALFALLLIGSLVVWLLRRRLFPGQRIKTRLANRLGPWFVTAAAIGLFATLLRVAEFPILSARVIWLVALLWIVGMLAYVARYFRTVYPTELVRLQREEQRQRFIPKPGRRKRPERRRR
jgi:tellurite resistance protein TehA-like permease